MATRHYSARNQCRVDPEEIRTYAVVTSSAQHEHPKRHVGNDAGTRMTRSELEQIVEGDSKARYSIDGDRVRANQGHSLQVDLGLAPWTPPTMLFHGTARRFLDSILEGGLRSVDGGQNTGTKVEVVVGQFFGWSQGGSVIPTIELGSQLFGTFVFHQ